MAAVLDLLALAKLHEPVTGSALPVACGAEGGNIPHVHQPAHHLIQGTLVGYVKLLRIVGTFLLAIASHGGSGCATDLGNAQSQQLFPDILAFPGGNNHAGIGHCDPDQSTQLCKNLVADAVIKSVGINVIRMLDPRHANRMGAHPMYRLQMLRMHQQSGKLIPIQLQTKQDAQSHIINTALHGTIHGFGMVVVVMLGTGGMQLQIAFLVIGFLEQDISTDARILQTAVVFHRSGCNIYIDPADGTVLVLDRIDGIDAIQNIFNGVVHRILSGFNGKPLMPHVLQGNDLPGNLLLGQLLPGNVLVLHMIGTVHTAVDAIVGQVQRGKNHDPVAVKVQLDLLRQFVYLRQLVRQLACQQHGSLPVGQTLPQLCLFNDLIDQLHIRLVGICISQSVPDFIVVDKIIGAHGFYIIHTFPLLLSSRRRKKAAPAKAQKPRWGSVIAVASPFPSVSLRVQFLQGVPCLGCIQVTVLL